MRYVRLKKIFIRMFAMGLLFFATLPVQAAKTRKVINVVIDSSVDKMEDGATDAIQDALDAAKGDKSNKTQYIVNLPQNGRFSLTKVLKVYDNTTIRLNGSTLVRGEEKSMLRLGMEDESYTGYGGHHDIVIEGGTFDGDAEHDRSTAGMIRLGHGNNITIRNMTFQNVYNAHHVEIAGCQNVTIENCVFKDFVGEGDTVNSANNEALQFDILHTKAHFSKYSKFDDTPCKNITVKNCTFDNLQRGIGTHSAVAGSYFTNIKFTDNIFTNIKGYAIIATNYRNAVIKDNTISNCGAGILFRSMVQGHNNFYKPLKGKVKIVNDLKSEISNNTIQVSDQKYKTTAYGISLYGENLTSKKKGIPKGNYTLKGVSVKKNTITMNNSGYGIWLQGADSCKVQKNVITMSIEATVSGKGNSDCIRLVKSKKDQITDNVLTQKKNNKKTKEACGMVITTNSNATIKGNQITNSPKDGIYVVSKSNAVITGNKIQKCGRYGLFASKKSKITDKKNKIKKAKKKSKKASSDSKIKKK